MFYIRSDSGKVIDYPLICDFATAVDIAEEYASENIPCGVFQESNTLCMYKTSDHELLKQYLQYSSDEWNALDNFPHEYSDKPSVYFDIDGTLGYWYADGRGMTYPEEILDPNNHYFRNIDPHPFMIALTRELQREGCDVCIISAADRNTINDKWEWIDEYLPHIPKENICFCPIGADKTEFVKGNADISVLIDDYPKNLEEWKGASVKVINNVNSHQEKFPEINCKKAEKELYSLTFHKELSYARLQISYLAASLEQPKALDDELDRCEKIAGKPNALAPEKSIEDLSR